MNAYRKDGKLVIEISEDALCNGAMFLPGHSIRVTDREKFLDFCAAHVCTNGDNGDFMSCSDLTRVLDALVDEALENDEGVEIG